MRVLEHSWELTIELEALAVIDASISVEKELEVTVGVLDRSDLVVLVDKVSNDISMSVSIVMMEVHLPQAFKIGREGRIFGEPCPAATKHGSDAARMVTEGRCFRE